MVLVEIKGANPRIQIHVTTHSANRTWDKKPSMLEMEMGFCYAPGVPSAAKPPSLISPP
jgi:hypothetical protein